MFQLVTRTTKETQTEYFQKTVLPKIALLDELYPDAKREKFLDGLAIIFEGRRVAYLALPKGKVLPDKKKRWSDE